MMNKTLFLKEIKSSKWLYIGILALITMYVSIIVGMYNPTMMEMMDQFFKTMPVVMAAVGFKEGSTTLLGFLVSYLYGFILMIFPMIFILIRSYGLVAKYVDKGSMVVLLTGQNKRRSVIMTQILVLTSSLFGLFLYLTFIQWLCIRVFFPQEHLLGQLLIINFGLFCLWLLIASISFFASTFFSDARLSLTIGSGIPVLMFIFQMISNLNDKVSFFKYFTLFSLFDGQAILNGETIAYIKIALMLILALIIFYVSGKIFKEKNLYI